MAKNIVYCADGTWDDSTSGTNVYKLFKALPNTATQVAYYDDGLGSDGSPLQRLTGGAFGNGIFSKIKDGYTKIAHAYETGDSLFLFGFSRGAYTARALAGMIAICGLPTGNFDDAMVDTAFDAYRNPSKRAELLATLKNYNLFDAKITMIGVWDTVGSLGIPEIPGILAKASSLTYGFLDTSLHPDVQHAYHALAIDERRNEFPPTIWTSPAAPNQELVQVWFSGVHCDVGGGYAETGLSDITLGWMMCNAQKLGLQFDQTVFAKYTLPLDTHFALDTIHESWKILWGLPSVRTVDANSTISNSVAARCMHDSNYKPRNLNVANGTLAGTYQMHPTIQ